MGTTVREGLGEVKGQWRSGGESNERKSGTNSVSSYAKDSLWPLGQVMHLLWVSVSPFAKQGVCQCLVWFWF